MAAMSFGSSGRRVKAMVSRTELNQRGSSLLGQMDLPLGPFMVGEQHAAVAARRVVADFDRGGRRDRLGLGIAGGEQTRREGNEDQFADGHTDLL
jgi:hypothetical protein